MRGFIVALLLILPAASLGKVIHADYRSWSIYGPSLPPNQLPLDRFTHLSYGETMPNADGSLLHPDTHADFQFIDPQLDGNVQRAGNLAALSHLQQSQPQLQLLLQIGGYGSDDNWAGALANHRDKLLTNIISILRNNNWQGVELEWHYPEGSVNQQNYLWLIRSLKEQGFTVVVSLPVRAITKDLWDLSQFNQWADYFTLNPYLAYGAWDTKTAMQWPLKSPVAEQISVQKSVAVYQHAGLQLNKLVLMLSPAAQGWQGTTNPYSDHQGMLFGPYDSEQASGLFPRAALQAVLDGEQNQAWQIMFDDANVGAFASNGSDLLTFESNASINQKVRWVLANNLAGIGISEVQHDVIDGDWSVSLQLFEQIASPWQKLYGWWQKHLATMIKMIGLLALAGAVVWVWRLWQQQQKQRQQDERQQRQLAELTQHLSRLQIASLLGLRYWQALNNARCLADSSSYKQAATFSTQILQHTKGLPLTSQTTEFELIDWLKHWQADLNGELTITVDQQALAQLIDIWWSSMQQPSLQVKDHQLILEGQNTLHLDQFAQFDRIRQIAKAQNWQLHWRDHRLLLELPAGKIKTDWQPLYQQLESSAPGKPWSDAISAFLQTISEPAVGQSIALQCKVLGGHDIQLADQQLPAGEHRQFQSMVAQLEVLGAQLSRITQSPQLLEDLHNLAANYQHISHIQSDRGYCQVHFIDQRAPLVSTLRLNAIKQWFNDDQWLAIHRSYLVNPNHCRAIETPSKNKHLLTLSNQIQLPIGRNQLGTVQQFIDDSQLARAL
ncbi:glycosyl hydrolase family 18 protein [Salinibius halmophilus]|uniref:glycosyl hydrolase family 18 protein n=1 Tax=Salinibius halmophilus TaxID=1853216 RepID=UPI000E66DEE5|nr:glycosyl hydrolase family 18 protein [Salinibius halmophilus]